MLHGAQEAVRRRVAIDASANDVSTSEWREVYGRMLLRLDLEPTLETPFRFQADMQAWPGLTLSDVTTTGMRATRNPEMQLDFTSHLFSPALSIVNNQS